MQIQSVYKHNSFLETPVRYIKGVGPKVAELLSKKRIETIADLVNFLPNKYLDRRKIDKINGLSVGKDKTVAAEVMACGIAFAGRRRKRIFEMLLDDGSGTISAKWFHFRPQYVMGTFKKGMWLLVSGEVTQYDFALQFIHPQVQVIDPEVGSEINALGIVPIYPSIEGIHQKSLRNILNNTLEKAGGHLPETIPLKIREELTLPPLYESFRVIHTPDKTEDVEELNSGRSPAHRRLIFEELFYLELKLAIQRRGMGNKTGIAFNSTPEMIDSIKSSLPFKLTAAQDKTMHEILDDMRKPSPMNRMIQGDVGSGKTVVALIACQVAIKNGRQAAFMVPTEILAEQHFATVKKVFPNLLGETVLVTGATVQKEKGLIYKRVASGDAKLIIGTHAVIQERVEFKNLGLAIVDEQHRFGVLQRAALKEKGARPWPPEGRPDLLVMTATPIPRTLAMTVYGDLDFSVIDEMPPGRQPIDTWVIGEKEREGMYDEILKKIEKGEQVFIVYPLVEESAKLDLKDATRMAGHLQKDVFKNWKVALLHGRMSAEEKDAIMKGVKDKNVDILVTTTVIEVGIDIPNATMLVVEHAERFGLSQLHQLRGRIGRGEKRSLCVLVASGNRSDEANRRLDVIAKTQDGFRIAEEDLSIRGPGDFLGTRQSGLPDFRVANLLRDIPLLAKARKEAFDIIARDPDLKSPEHRCLKERLDGRTLPRVSLAEV